MVTRLAPRWVTGHRFQSCYSHSSQFRLAIQLRICAVNGKKVLYNAVGTVAKTDSVPVHSQQYQFNSVGVSMVFSGSLKTAKRGAHYCSCKHATVKKLVLSEVKIA